MNQTLASNDPGTQKRRSTRIVQAIPLTVTGVDALGQPFKERTTTVMVNCHGCKYQSKHYVPKNSTITLEVPRLDSELSPRTVVGRVVWVQRPRAVRELFQIGLEFEVAGNVWGIAFPPEDWFPYPDDETPTVSEQWTPQTKTTAAPPKLPSGAIQSAPASVSGIEKPEAPPAATAATISAAKPPATVPPPSPGAAVTENKVHVMPTPGQTQEAQLAAAQQVSNLVAEAKETLEKTLRKGAHTAINDEMTFARQQLDDQLHDAVERAIKISMERMTESSMKKVVQQAADRTAAIVEEARKASESSAGHLESRLRQAVEEMVAQAAQQTARQTAEQATAQDLKETVQATVEQILSEREITDPQVSSLAEAEQQIQQWKRGLAEEAEGVRRKTVEQTEADTTAASQRWNQTLESELTQATTKLGESLNGVSDAALKQIDESISARTQTARTSMDEIVSAAMEAVQSLGAGLQQERARTEETRNQLQDAARSSLEQTRHDLDQMVSSQLEGVARKAEQIVEERVQRIDPVFQNSARKAVEQLSAEIRDTVTPQIDEARRASAELVNAQQTAVNLQATLLQRFHEAAEQAAQAQNRAREQAQQASEEAVRASLEKLRQETAKYPAEAVDACRTSLTKLEEEFEQKNTEAQHATYEALSKAADWYQKKAQTTMQSTMEKAVEQSATNLRHQAAEISSLVASELDHYRRSYVDHGRAQMEEVTKEVVDLGRGKLRENAEIVAASLSDRVQQVTKESLRRFEESTRDALEKARSDMEYDREGSLGRFQQQLDEKMTQGVEQAQTYLQSQLVPLIEAWEANRKAQQQVWIEGLKQSTDDAMGQYKSRLENASNSWLLASATTLGQNSQSVIDALAKSAEKRLRDTFAEVLAGMGDVLKERLIGLSGQFNKDDDEQHGKK
jgi:hypothetical protein